MDVSSKVMVVDAADMLGDAICRMLRKQGYEKLLPVSEQDLDLMERDAVFQCSHHRLLSGKVLNGRQDSGTPAVAGKQTHGRYGLCQKSGQQRNHGRRCSLCNGLIV